MSNSLRFVGLAALVAVTLVSNLSAQQPGRRPGGRDAGGFRNPTQLPESLSVTAEQKTKLADIDKKFADKIKAAQDKSKLTEEQTTKQREAFGKLRDSGKSFTEIRDEVAKELNLTADQKKGREELTAIVAEITKEVDGVLTEEQKTKLKELRAARGRPGDAPGKRPERKKE